MAKKKTPSTALAAEWQTFTHRIKELQNCLFNIAFVLDTKGAMRRRNLLVLISLSLSIVLGGKLLTGTEWKTQLSESFSYILQIKFMYVDAINPFPDLLSTLAKAYFSPAIIRLFPIFLIPFLVSLRTAAKYLSDIFELDDENIAYSFINQATFGSEYEEIVIENGAVAEKYKNSPIIKIGGPGRVKIDLYSAVLFEKPNGRSRVIGPPAEKEKKQEKNKIIQIVNKILNAFKKKKKGGAVIEGFERLRDIVDLRDQITDPKEISARTRDGIKIKAKNVRMVSSIWRGDLPKEKMSENNSYPFRKEAVPSQIYYQGSIVSPALKAKRARAPINPMPGRISGEMSKFISTHDLSDFFSSAGLPEIEKLKERAAAHANRQKKVSGLEEDLSSSDESTKPSAFNAREEISNLFSEFAEEFSNTNRKTGVELYWLGVGIWITPSEIIPSKNLKAWDLSKENAKKGSDKKLKEAEDKEKLEEFLRLFRKVPLSSARLSGAPNSLREKTTRNVLMDYRELIKRAKVYLEKYTDEYPKEYDALFDNAIKQIDKRINHWIE